MELVNREVTSKALLEMWRASRTPIHCVFASPDGKAVMSLDGIIDEFTPQHVRFQGDGWGVATLYHEDVLFPDDSRLDWAVFGLSKRPRGTSVIAVLPDGVLFGMFEVLREAVH